MAFYKLFSERIADAESGRYTAYGIVATDDHSTRIIEDISVDKEKVLALVALFNSEALAMVHLDQAVEDFLYDFKV